jgi:hypothetical protein
MLDFKCHGNVKWAWLREVNMESNDATFTVDQLEYYQAISRRNTWLARAMLLSVIMSRLGANMWMSQRNYESMLINVDQTRLAQMNLFEAEMERIRQLESQVVALQTKAGDAQK